MQLFTKEKLISLIKIVIKNESFFCCVFWEKKNSLLISNFIVRELMQFKIFFRVNMRIPVMSFTIN